MVLNYAQGGERKLAIRSMEERYNIFKVVVSKNVYFHRQLGILTFAYFQMGGSTTNQLFTYIYHRDLNQRYVDIPCSSHGSHGVVLLWVLKGRENPLADVARSLGKI